jgi:hypothetical protein
MAKAVILRTANGTPEARMAAIPTVMQRRAGTRIQVPTVMEVAAIPARQAVLQPLLHLRGRIIILQTNTITGRGDAYRSSLPAPAPVQAPEERGRFTTTKATTVLRDGIAVVAAAVVPARRTHRPGAAVLRPGHPVAVAAVPDPLQVQDQEAGVIKIFLWHRING